MGGACHWQNGWQCGWTRTNSFPPLVEEPGPAISAVLALELIGHQTVLMDSKSASGGWEKKLRAKMEGLAFRYLGGDLELLCEGRWEGTWEKVSRAFWRGGGACVCPWA